MDDDDTDGRNTHAEVEPPCVDTTFDSTDDVDADGGGWVEGVRRDRPVLYATRHLIKPLLQVVVVLVGIGALLRALLPRIDVNVEWLDSLDSWGRKHMSGVPDPLGWAARWLREGFGDVQVADWIESVLRTAKWWLPILLALAVAVNEVHRRWEADTTEEPELDDAHDHPEDDERDGTSKADGQTNDLHGHDDEEGSL